MNKNIILFDGVCNLCNSTVQFVIKNDTKNHFLFASLQSEFGQTFLKNHHLNETDFDSIILVEGNKYYMKSDAALRICEKLNFPLKTLTGFLILPKKLRDLGYDLIAKNRYKWFGKQESCWLPTQKLKSKFLS